MLAREKPRKAGAALIEIPLPFGSDDEIDARWLVIVKTVVIPRLKIRVKSNSRQFLPDSSWHSVDGDPEGNPAEDDDQGRRDEALGVAKNCKERLVR